MKEKNGKLPDPKEIEREIGEFLAKRFGGDVKIVSPINLPQELSLEAKKIFQPKPGNINFDLKPRDLIAYLDQYIVRQDQAKAVLATKICTHFNRIKHLQHSNTDYLTGRVKSNILMLGPTGVGKTYMIKLIAKKIGVPFVKGDATKFSETGYVGADVEDLIRDLVREADDNIELAGFGIIYIDEIDKIASNHNFIGADISRTGVQRALLKPMEETDVELKVPHDPISIIQEIEKFRKTGKREKNIVNTKNILFIMSGAFADLSEIINKRLSSQEIGFGARIKGTQTQDEILKQVRSEDLIEFGFESEFAGRLPVHAVLQKLSENDLFEILKNPNNPVILGKKFDFAAYGIKIIFEDTALEMLAKQAFNENTGARGLVSAIERALLPFEKSLPSTDIKIFPVTKEVVENPEKIYNKLYQSPDIDALTQTFDKMALQEKEFIKDYLRAGRKNLNIKNHLNMTPSRIDIIADYYCSHTTSMEFIINKVKKYSDEIKKIELFFYKNNDINIVMEDDAIDYFIEQLINNKLKIDNFYKQFNLDFEYGLKLVREKTGQNRFFITRKAMTDPEAYISDFIKTTFS
ncbi:ATP-dependent Clp protease, ATP-binding subunit [Desulfonema limicola]|uniref:ATP-dependent Clp protease, ATP-binding subunit n=1 Tax=Desulfonema limicola TaxID=45656 RepID=A0A975BCL1_9BACT|nr:AAA family ATPase [Desulfonema limicola]QTA82896.1 ATP-dependent Clp protease, ATP-binding subunit [Desulfonema limicola]